jgi:hypothetical protein
MWLYESSYAEGDDINPDADALGYFRESATDWLVRQGRFGFDPDIVCEAMKSWTLKAPINKCALCLVHPNIEKHFSGVQSANLGPLARTAVGTQRGNPTVDETDTSIPLHQLFPCTTISVL